MYFFTRFSGAESPTGMPMPRSKCQMASHLMARQEHISGVSNGLVRGALHR